MAVNALDPTKPTLLDQSIELTAELRAIKQRLVTDKANIEQLQNTLINVQGITEYGSQLLASTDSDNALTILDFSVLGKELSQLADYADLALALGVESPIPTLSIGTNKWSIALPGTLKLNIVKVAVPSAGVNITWQTPFGTAVYGVWATLNSGADFPAFITTEDLVGCKVDHNNLSTHTAFVLAIGQ